LGIADVTGYFHSFVAAVTQLILIGRTHGKRAREPTRRKMSPFSADPLPQLGSKGLREAEIGTLLIRIALTTGERRNIVALEFISFP
jgi:hypothetical protein